MRVFLDEQSVRCWKGHDLPHLAPVLRVLFMFADDWHPSQGNCPATYSIASYDRLQAQSVDFNKEPAATPAKCRIVALMVTANPHKHEAEKTLRSKACANSFQNRDNNIIM